MPQPVGLALEDRDTTVMVAVGDSPGAITDGAVCRARLPRNPMERSGETLAGAMSRVRPAARAVVAALTDLHPAAGRSGGDFQHGIAGSGRRQHRYHRSYRRHLHHAHVAGAASRARRRRRGKSWESEIMRTSIC